MNLSIIVPVYNVAEYLEECLDSIVTQEMIDYEIICIDDGSTDDSFNILNKYAEKNMQITIIQHGENKGLSAARNTGIKAAKGEYVQFVDSDDMLKPMTCKRLYQYAKETDADIVYFNMTFLNDIENSLIRKEQKNNEYKGIYSGRELFCIHQSDKTLKPEAVRHFIKRKFICDNNLSFYEGIIHEDMLFSFMIAMKAERVVDLNQELYIYRQRVGSISWSQQERTASSLLVCLFNICGYWLTNDFSKYENKCIADYIRGIYDYYAQYKCYQNNSSILGHEKERMLQKILTDNYFGDIKFNKQDILRLKKSQVNILYGAGKIATGVVQLLRDKGILFSLVVVTKKEHNASSMNGLSIIGIDELTECNEAEFVIATNKRHHADIVKTLEYKGYNNIIIPIVN